MLLLNFSTGVEGNTIWLSLNRSTDPCSIPSLFCPLASSFFFFNDTATTEIYTLSLHDALPIFPRPPQRPRLLVDLLQQHLPGGGQRREPRRGPRIAGHADLDREGDGPVGCLVAEGDRKSTRLNSSHTVISYAVFCLKKKKQQQTRQPGRHPQEQEHLRASARHDTPERRRQVLCSAAPGNIRAPQPSHVDEQPTEATH